MKKKLAVAAFALAVAVVFLPASAFATSTVKMTTYSGAVKSGNTVYCAAPGWGIYKATVKNGKVTQKKWLQKETSTMWTGSDIGSMKKSGKYIYYIASTEGTISYLNRINVSTGKSQTLCMNPKCYVIKNKKIYVKTFDAVTEKTSYYVMKLNGKSKKTTSVHPVMKHKASNAKGYSVSYKQSGSYVKTYLKTPKGKYNLGKVRYAYNY